MAKREKCTLGDIAREVNVSPATVSMILRGTPGMRFSEETVRRVSEAADALGYRKSSAKGTFDRPTIAVIVPYITGGYYSFIAQSITQQANARGADTIILETHRSAERESRILSSLMRMGVAGAIFTARPINESLAVRTAQRLPVVIISNKPRDLPLDSVTTDDYRVGTMISDYLLALGHRNVAFIEIGRQRQGIAISQRLIAVQDRFRAHPDAKLTVYSMPAPDTLRPGSFIETREMARKTSAECLKDPNLTAFICISDYCAYGVMEALSERGLRVPEDYSLCGLDDMFPSSLPGVRLTTIDRHPIEIGASSLDLLWQRITSPALPTLTHVTRVEYLSTLIDRGSCASPRTKPKIAPDGA